MAGVCSYRWKERKEVLCKIIIQWHLEEAGVACSSGFLRDRGRKAGQERKASAS